MISNDEIVRLVQKSKLADAGPYTVWPVPKLPGSAAVLDSKGFNCCSWERGVVFCPIEVAQAIANKWNGQ